MKKDRADCGFTTATDLCYTNKNTHTAEKLVLPCVQENRVVIKNR